MSIVTTDRTEYIAGLRQLADLLESNEDLPLPDTGTSQYGAIHWLLFTDDDHEQQKDVARRIVRAFPGPVDKWDTENLFRFSGHLDGLHWQVVVDRPAVCERVVTGTREVTKTVPDPAAPLVEVTETVEDVEWRCQPLLADVEQVAS